MKLATRGVARSRTSVKDIGYRAFKAALSRPERFQSWLSSHGVAVAGRNRLQWVAPQEDGEAALPRLRRLERDLLRWLDRGAAEQEVPISLNLSLKCNTLKLRCEKSQSTFRRINCAPSVTRCSPSPSESKSTLVRVPVVTVYVCASLRCILVFGCKLDLKCREQCI